MKYDNSETNAKQFCLLKIRHQGYVWFGLALRAKNANVVKWSDYHHDRHCIRHSRHVITRAIWSQTNKSRETRHSPVTLLDTPVISEIRFKKLESTDNFMPRYSKIRRSTRRDARDACDWFYVFWHSWSRLYSLIDTPRRSPVSRFHVFDISLHTANVLETEKYARNTGRRSLAYAIVTFVPRNDGNALRDTWRVFQLVCVRLASYF